MIAVDLFAGGGGASEGIRAATGRAPIIAVNHDAAAIAMHGANHPDTRHFCESVYDVRPWDVVVDLDVDLLWASPDCTHHSRAKGGKPRDNKRRGLAWVVHDWAATVRPRMIALENVPEFVTWGPLGDDGQPIKARAGETFAEFVEGLRARGYDVAWRVLNAADYGAPTSRKRLFLLARRDGAPIVWPEPTHGPGRALPWRTAAECIDWSIPVPSIFDRPRPLAEATQRRIAEGIRRFVLNTPRPFLVRYNGDARYPGDRPRTEDLDGPLPTVTTENRFGLVTPFVSKIDNKSSGPGAVRGVEAPLSTITQENGHALVAPVLVQTGYGERPGQAPRALDLGAPLGTVVAGGPKHALVAAFLARHFGGTRPPIGKELDAPLPTITAVDHHAVVAAHLTQFNGRSVGGDLGEPAPTATGRNHAALVAAFLAKYYGTDRHGQGLGEPLHTIPTVDRFGLVTVSLEGEPWALVDIGMRMLQPRELARAQGFPDSYVLTGSKTEQVARIGNSVCPPVAEAVVRALVNTPVPKRRARQESPRLFGEAAAK